MKTGKLCKGGVHFSITFFSFVAAVHGKNTGVWFCFGFLSVGAADGIRWTCKGQRVLRGDHGIYFVFWFTSMGCTAREPEIAFMEELLDGRHREGRVARIKATSSRL